MRLIIRTTLFLLVLSVSAAAQTPANDPSDRLSEVLPDQVRERVLATIAEARARELPVQALEHRALELAAKGAPADVIARRIEAQAEALARGKAALERGRDVEPTADEVEAAGEAIGRGVSGEAVSTLASSAPSGRSLDVPLFVLSELMSRGLPADAAIERVHARLNGRDTDDEMRADAAHGGTPWGEPGRPPVTGRELGETLRPGSRGGPPAGVPANPGVSGSVPTPGQKPTTPPVQPPAGPPPG